MIPHLMNCSHQGEGWCLECVKNLHDRLEEFQEENEYLKWFRLNCDFGPGEGDYIQALHKQFKKETGKELPEGWEYE